MSKPFHFEKSVPHILPVVDGQRDRLINCLWSSAITGALSSENWEFLRKHVVKSQTLPSSHRERVPDITTKIKFRFLQPRKGKQKAALCTGTMSFFFSKLKGTWLSYSGYGLFSFHSSFKAQPGTWKADAGRWHESSSLRQNYAIEEVTVSMWGEAL